MKFQYAISFLKNQTAYGIKGSKHNWKTANETGGQ